mmetsp:Transcript_43385/g.52060  ORF Transcript_43385/g.52060 Transcript_43385/m.52060 type:complete len:221 (+) Transcript_43385:1270-1932(+)
MEEGFPESRSSCHVLETSVEKVDQYSPALFSVSLLDENWESEEVLFSESLPRRRLMEPRRSSSGSSVLLLESFFSVSLTFGLSSESLTPGAGSLALVSFAFAFVEKNCACAGREVAVNTFGYPWISDCVALGCRFWNECGEQSDCVYVEYVWVRTLIGAFAWTFVDRVRSDLRASAIIRVILCFICFFWVTRCMCFRAFCDFFLKLISYGTVFRCFLSNE